MKKEWRRVLNGRLGGRAIFLQNFRPTHPTLDAGLEKNEEINDRGGGGGGGRKARRGTQLGSSLME